MFWKAVFNKRERKHASTSKCRIMQLSAFGNSGNSKHRALARKLVYYVNDSQFSYSISKLCMSQQSRVMLTLLHGWFCYTAPSILSLGRSTPAPGGRCVDWLAWVQVGRLQPVNRDCVVLVALLDDECLVFAFQHFVGAVVWWCECQARRILMDVHIFRLL